MMQLDDAQLESVLLNVHNQLNILYTQREELLRAIHLLDKTKDMLVSMQVVKQLEKDKEIKPL